MNRIKIKRVKYIQLHIRIPRGWVLFLVDDMECIKTESVSAYFRALLLLRMQSDAAAKRTVGGIAR